MNQSARGATEALSRHETVIETERLLLACLCESDAEFVLELLNEPAFHLHIGDKGVRTREDARTYLTEGPIASYALNGFGLYRVALKSTHEPVGICGLLKRDALDHPDLGYALLERHWSKGYALEAATATMRYARENLGLRRVLAITSLGNDSSIKLLEKIDFQLDAVRPLAEGVSPSKIFSWLESNAR